MNIRWRVELSQDEREELTALLKSGRHAVGAKSSARRFSLPPMTASVTARSRLAWEPAARRRTKRRFVEGNLELALVEAPRPGAQRKLSGKEEALLIPPPARPRRRAARAGSLKLLADVMVALTEHEGLSRDRDRASAPGGERAEALAPGHVVRSQGRRRLCRRHGGRARPLWRAPRSHASGDLLRREPDPADRRSAAPMNGRARPAGALRLRVQAQRTVNPSSSSTSIAPGARSRSPSACRRRLLPMHARAQRRPFPRSRKDPGRHGQPLDPQPGLPLQRPARTRGQAPLPPPGVPLHPKHASWLNMVEIEIGVLRGQCLDRRISSRDILEAEVTPPGSDSATTAPRASNGCSRRRKPDTN